MLNEVPADVPAVVAVHFTLLNPRAVVVVGFFSFSFFPLHRYLHSSNLFASSVAVSLERYLWDGRPV
jgi:hypothetical protein